MKPEDAFQHIDTGTIKNRSVTLGASVEIQDPETLEETFEPTAPGYFLKSLKYVSAAVSLAIIALLAAGAYLLSIPKTSDSAAAPPTEPPTAFSDGEIHAIITGNLTRFLECSTTEERIDYIADPDIEATHLADYYEARRNRDSPLRTVHIIKPIQISGHTLWVVSYTDAENARRSATFLRDGNRFLLNWSSSYAYGDLPWDVFSTARPAEPVAMRAFLLHHHGDPPPGYTPLEWAAYIVEDKAGEFTQLAVMRRSAEGQSLIEESPAEARLPVNIELHYGKDPQGQPQLIIDRLVHFKWWADPSQGKGTNSQRTPSVTNYGIDTLN